LSERARQDREKQLSGKKKGKRKIWSLAPEGVPDTKAERLTDRLSQPQLNSNYVRQICCLCGVFPDTSALDFQITMLMCEVLM
jgi:hypothetical protein